MDAFDEPVRQSINSPVPQGDTFAKFGSVRNGIWWKPAKEGPHSHVTDPWNNFDPKSAEFTPAPTSNKPFPTNALVEATLSLQERDPQVSAPSTHSACLYVCHTVPLSHTVLSTAEPGSTLSHQQHCVSTTAQLAYVHARACSNP
jgi:hypothetical protein